MLFDFISVFSKVRGSQHFFADDTIDKLNRSVTVIFLVIASVLIGAKNIVGASIVCVDDGYRMQPTTMDYVQSVCWAKNTFHQDSMEDPHSKRTEVKYYQWMPIIMLVLAALYYAPYFIWKLLMRTNTLKNYVTIDISGIITTLKGRETYKMKEFNSSIQAATEYLHQCFILNTREYREALKNGQLEYDSETDKVNLIKVSDNYERRLANTCSQLLRNHLFFKYMLIKLMYIGNSIGLFFYLNYFIYFNGGFFYYGIEFFKTFFKVEDSAKELWNSNTFPRQVFCELKFRGDSKNVQEYKFQCSLPANVYYEKIFLFIWVWGMIVLVLNVCSLWSWIMRAFTRRSIIKKYLNLNSKVSQHISTRRNDAFSTDRILNDFLDRYLQFDGYFTLLMLMSNLNSLCMTKLIDRLWKSYQINYLDDVDIMSPNICDSAATAKVGRNFVSPNLRRNLNDENEMLEKDGNEKGDFNNNNKMSYIGYQKEDLV